MKAFWSIFFSVFFAALAIMGLEWLIARDLIATWITPWEFVLLSLAVFRLVRLFSYDLITAFLREWLAGREQNTFLGTLSSLITCPWCTGLWFSSFVIFFYFATPYAWPVILVLAVAGAASLMQILANLIGWHAEGKKLEVVKTR
jgi:hypothetical protein